MPRTKSWSRVALVATAASALFAACDSTTTDAPAPDAGIVDDTGPLKVQCPTDAPDDGAPCTLPVGTTCDFGSCGTRLAVCRGGVWTYGGNPAPDPPCPTDPPKADSACPDCWPTRKTCTYFAEKCFAPSPDAGPQNIAVASCVASQWSVSIRPCSTSDGGEDAGADVQGDGGLDAD